MEATTTLPKAKTRCGPEFAAQAYLACTKGVADARQQQSTAAQLAIAKADKAALVDALEGLMELERRGRLMPIGREWDAARAAIAKATA